MESRPFLSWCGCCLFLWGFTLLSGSATLPASLKTCSVVQHSFVFLISLKSLQVPLRWTQCQEKDCYGSRSGCSRETRCSYTLFSCVIYNIVICFYFLKNFCTSVNCKLHKTSVRLLRTLRIFSVFLNQQAPNLAWQLSGNVGSPTDVFSSFNQTNMFLIVLKMSLARPVFY